MIQEIRVASKFKDNHGGALFSEIQRTLGFTQLTAVRAVKVYRFQGIDQATAQQLADKALVDPIEQISSCNTQLSFNAKNIVEVAYKPGVMNPECASLFKAATALNIQDLQAVDTSFEYHFSGDLTPQELQTICDRLLVNKTVARIITEKPSTLIVQGTTPRVQQIPISSMSLAEFHQFASKQQLFLTEKECEAIQLFFKQLGREPFDAELETIAQTWSEHCSHKTFKAKLTIDGVEKKSLFSRLRETAQQYNTNTVSAFDDNAGVFRFYDGYAIAAKVETHNSPSAIEPYGGAATGSGGVFRDIMGTGQGAKVIASSDIFCLASPDLPHDQVPAGCLHPHYLLRNVIAGVRDYGNRMGIPTNNGSLHFHNDFRAKPTVIVGAYGLIPEDRAKKGVPRIGDHIVVVGGKTGRDGIHGATFSSDAMTDQTSTVSATAVQIGNPIEQKRMADALLAARDADLIQAITDCGAGGFSSAIGEMTQKLGAVVDLAKAPLKYAGLMPWEIWISESQERMVCAIAPENTHAFRDICDLYNVQADDIGYFSGTEKIQVMFHDQIVCDLDCDFLHNGCPITSLVATSPQISNHHDEQSSIPITSDRWITCIKRLLAHPTICSKQPIVRQYDHTVQGMSALAPFAGLHEDGPQDAAVLVPLYGKPYGLLLSHGLNPILNRIDPYAGACWAITEALANIVSAGGNPNDCALVDNFIWPKPHAQLLWSLDQAMQACIDAMQAFEIPFISGKDSLSSTYQYADGSKLEIPPVLCISAFGKIPDVAKMMSSHIKQPDSLLLVIGDIDADALGGSLYYELLSINSNRLPKSDLKSKATLFAQLHDLIAHGSLLACHDISEGGLAVALAEICFGSPYGIELDLAQVAQPLDRFLFAEAAGCFVVEVTQKEYQSGAFANIAHTVIGNTTPQQSYCIRNGKQELFSVSIQELKEAWQQTMKDCFE